MIFFFEDGLSNGHHYQKGDDYDESSAHLEALLDEEDEEVPEE